MFVLFILFSKISLAFFNFSPKIPASALDTDAFIAPNERRPHLMEPVLKESKEGIYVALGTERGFIGSALSNANYLLLVDHNKRAIKFNRATILLLKATKDGNQYIQLKRNPELLWDKIQSLPLSTSEKNYLMSVVRTQWWRDVVKSMNETGFFSRGLMAQIDGPGEFSGGTRYWTDKKNFAKLQAMAREGRIKAEYLDLGNLNEVKHLSSQLKKANLTISVLDLSNAVTYEPIDKKMEKIYTAFLANGNDNSIALFTKRAPGSWYFNWDYYGAQFSLLKKLMVSPNPNGESLNSRIIREAEKNRISRSFFGCATYYGKLVQ